MASDINFLNIFFSIFARKAVGLIQNKYSTLGCDLLVAISIFSFSKIRCITNDIGDVLAFFFGCVTPDHNYLQNPLGLDIIYTKECPQIPITDSRTIKGKKEKSNIHS